MFRPNTLPTARRMRSRKRWIIAVAQHARRLDRLQAAALWRIHAPDAAWSLAPSIAAADLMQAWRTYVANQAHGRPILTAPISVMPVPAGTDALPPELAQCVRDIVESAAWLEWALDSLVDDLTRRPPAIDLAQASLDAVDAQIEGLGDLVEQWFAVVLSLQGRFHSADVPVHAHQALAQALLELGERLEHLDGQRHIAARDWQSATRSPQPGGSSFVH